MSPITRQPRSTCRRGFGLIVAVGSARIGTSEAHAQELLAEWDSQHGLAKVDDQFGNSMAPLGDLDADGWPEVIIAAYKYNTSGAFPEAGAAFVMSTKDGSFLRSHFGSAKFGLFGNAVDGGADLDGDGVADYIVGAPVERGRQNSSGRVHVYSGATGAELYALDGERFSDSFGHDVSFVDDLDGDGTCEVVVVARWWDDPVAGLGQCGRGYCYSGRRGTLLWTFDGTQQDQWMYSCCPLDDYDNDGIPEVGFGSIGTGSGAAGEGTFDVVSGASGQSLLQIAGESAKDSFGRCGRIGDVDRDGARDVVIGAPGHSTAGVFAGRVYVVSGSTYSRLFTFDGPAASEFFGGVPPRFGEFDANGDGWTDIVIG
ncbi:MAG: FG-GAP repeat protein [Planctomycetes bacterium]|nr:FG-GAP repeat protein [Planctomycetota bacterium]